MPSLSEQKFVEKWEKTREKGRLHHHLLFGTLWGVFMFVFVTLFDLAEMSFWDAYFSKRALLKILTWWIGGVALYAPIMWYDSNLRYRKLTGKKE